MKKLITPIILSFVMAVSILAPATYAHHKNYDDYYDAYGSPFNPNHPDYYDGNLRLELKNRADIERKSKPNPHYDSYTRKTYNCDWKFHKELGTWVCEKDYIEKKAKRAEPVAVCPLGYQLSVNKTYCIKESQTTTSVVPQAYAAEEPQYEITRYVYIYGDEETTSEPKFILAQTGPGGIVWMLLLSVYGALFFHTRSKSRQLGKALRKEQIQAQSTLRNPERTR